MKFSFQALVFVVFAVFTLTPTSATINAPVNIAFPLSGGTVTNYFDTSFTVTCPGGANYVKYGFDGSSIGYSEFYDTIGVHFHYKLPAGWHVLYVSTSCGDEKMKFQVL
ncbi:hypothetical protein HK098_007614 [Nowakowskiella sp. JEL0407]|nr:hypothetical protein HK098_007614 [Nowakowskiella sp. JEL0407]